MKVALLDRVLERLSVRMEEPVTLAVIGGELLRDGESVNVDDRACDGVTVAVGDKVSVFDSVRSEDGVTDDVRMGVVEFVTVG